MDSKDKDDIHEEHRIVAFGLWAGVGGQHDDCGTDLFARLKGNGRFSCFHGEERPSPPADQRALSDHINDAERKIVEYYEEASRRLPLEEIPDLAGWIYAAGHCFGFADPVTNIMLNAIAMLLFGEREHAPPPPPPTSETRHGSYQMAARSYTGLCASMAAYFRHLSSMQARRYLHLARCSLPVAVMLVRFDRSADGEHCFPFPDGGLAKAALRSAAIQAEHPAPHILAGAMTAQYPASLLDPVMTKLQLDCYKLSTGDVREIKELLSQQWPPSEPRPATIGLWCRPESDSVSCTRRGKNKLLIPVCLGEGVVARVLIQSGGGDDLHDEPLKYITDDVDFAQLWRFQCFPIVADDSRDKDNHGITKVNYDDRPCEYMLYLKMSMLETIHSRYIEAISILPSTAWTPRFIRALLVAGHCYGPMMDPVANILINTIWYDIVLGVDVELPKEILGTTPLSRIVSRSLDGLVAIWDPIFKSEHASLCSIYHHHGCSSGQFLSQQSEPCRRALLVAAAKAAKHPQHAEFASFLAFLNVSRLNSLLSRRDTRISEDSWHLLTNFIREEAAQHAVPVSAEVPILVYSFGLPPSSGDKLNFFRAELKKLLRDYCYKHPWEPSYHLDFICGVMESSKSPFHPALYHANFLARFDEGAENHDFIPSDPPRKLFFAEFWGPSSMCADVGSKLCNCSPVHPSSIGRCSICECEASMIIHPPSGGHSGDIDGSIDVYPRAVETMLQFGFEASIGTEIIYCDHKRYVPKDLPVTSKHLPGTSSRPSPKRQKPVQRLTESAYRRIHGNR